MTEILIVFVASTSTACFFMGLWIDKLQRRNKRSEDRIDELMAQLRETDGERATRLRKQLDESYDEMEAVQDLNRLYENHFGKPLL